MLTMSPGTSCSMGSVARAPSRRTLALTTIIFWRAATLAEALPSWLRPIAALNSVRPMRTTPVATWPGRNRLRTPAASSTICIGSLVLAQERLPARLLRRLGELVRPVRGAPGLGLGARQAALERDALALERGRRRRGRARRGQAQGRRSRSRSSIRYLRGPDLSVDVRPRGSASPNAALTSALLRYNRMMSGMSDIAKPMPVPGNWKNARTASNRLIAGHDHRHHPGPRLERPQAERGEDPGDRRRRSSASPTGRPTRTPAGRRGPRTSRTRGPAGPRTGYPNPASSAKKPMTEIRIGGFRMSFPTSFATGRRTLGHHDRTGHDGHPCNRTPPVSTTMVSTASSINTGQTNFSHVP